MRAAVRWLGQTVVMVTHDPTPPATPTGWCSSPTAGWSTSGRSRPTTAVLDAMRALGDELMWKLTLVGVLGHKLRYALTALAVLLGVAFIAGTLVLTDTSGAPSTGCSPTSTTTPTRWYAAQQAFYAGGQLRQRAAPDPGAAWPSGCARGAGRRPTCGWAVDGYAQLIGKDGKAIGNPAAGAPTLGEAWRRRPLTPYRFLPGSRPPTTPTEVAIDKHSADVGKLRIGDQVRVLTKGCAGQLHPHRHLPVGQRGQPARRVHHAVRPATASGCSASPARSTRSTSPPRRESPSNSWCIGCRPRCPDRPLEVMTGKQITTESQNSVRKALGFFNTFLLVFALIALFVGSFLIFNTFSIVVAQRLRELALLRAVGASRRQVHRSRCSASRWSSGCSPRRSGWSPASAWRSGCAQLLIAFGIDIPSAGLLVIGRTVLVSIGAGTVDHPAGGLLAGPQGRPGGAGGGDARGDRLGGDPPGTSSDLRHRGAGGRRGGVLIGLFGKLGNRIGLVGFGAAVDSSEWRCSAR